MPTKGQKTIPLKDWDRFLKIADWWDRTFGHREPTALRPEYGRDILVLTPEDGIDARNGTTIYSETCTVCVIAETATPGQRLIHETASELVVYNIHPYAIPGEIYVDTGLTIKGTRYIKYPAGQVLRGKLDGDLDSGGSATMSVWEGSPLADSGRNITVYDSSTLPLITAGYKIASGVAIKVSYYNGKFYLDVPGACEVAQ